MTLFRALMYRVESREIYAWKHLDNRSDWNYWKELILRTSTVLKNTSVILMLQQWLNQRYEVFTDSTVIPVLSLFTMKDERLYISTSNYFWKQQNNPRKT